MSPIAIEIALIVGLLLLNGVFSMSEMAVVAAKRSRLARRAADGDAGAQAALDLAAQPNAFLSTVQVGITLVGVLAGAFGGAGIAELLAASLGSVAWLAPYAEPVAFGLVVAAITYLSLIFGELVPKRIALSDPERVAALVARPMRIVARAGSPLVALLTGSTNAVFRLLGIAGSAEPGVTEHDIRALVAQGAETGVVQEAERTIVENAFRLGDRGVKAIMTPRPDVSWIDLADDVDAIAEQIAAGARDRMLVCDGGLDRVVGVLHAGDLLARCMAGDVVVDAARLRAIAREPLYVPDSMPAFRLLETFRRTRQHAAVVLDEYGAVAGMATLDDLLEALIGEVPVDDAADTPSIVRQPDGSWLIDASTPLDDVENALGLDVPERERDDVLTLGGLVMSRLGHLPRRGESFAWAAHRVEVVAMDGRRIVTVRVVAD